MLICVILRIMQDCGWIRLLAALDLHARAQENPRFRNQLCLFKHAALMEHLSRASS